MRALVIDDERLVGLTIKEFLESKGHTVERSENAVEGLQLFERLQPDVVLLDLQLPDAQGLDLIPTIAQHPTHPTYVIIITAAPDAETAVAALKRGAWDYLVKPINFDELSARLQRLSRFMQLEKEVSQEREQAELREMRTNHPQMRAAHRLALEASRGEHPVFIVGEVGTGRMELARGIHAASPRRNDAFLTWTPTQDPQRQRAHLAQLVGAEPGVLAPGSDRRRGILDLVGDGSLVMREVHLLGPSEQRLLSQLLINRSYSPLGGGVRTFTGRLMMTATPAILRADETPDFSPELRHQVLGHHIQLPPLRDRQQDLFDIIQAFIRELNLQYGTNIQSIEPAAIVSLMAYPWPGNLNELHLVLERLWLKVPNNRILRKHLPGEFLRSNGGGNQGMSDVPTLAMVERQHISRVLEMTGGNQTRAAKMLDIARSTLINKLKQFQDEAEGGLTPHGPGSNGFPPSGVEVV